MVIVSKRPVIYLVGNSRKTRGGIGYVIKSCLEAPFLQKKYRFIHISTHSDGNN